MYLTGFADEAADDFADQIRATQALGWRWIESRRAVGTTNLHDISEADFDRICQLCANSGVGVNCFGSTIANWACSVNDPFEQTIAIVERTIARMQRLGSSFVRIMSYRVEHEAGGYDDEHQQAAERFRRLREITARFRAAGLTPVHENCMNYGGMGPSQTLRLLEAVPELDLVFDTGNPIFTPEYRLGGREAPRQSAWDFYRQVRERIAYVHIKDGRHDQAAGKTTYTYPGDGDGSVARIVRDLVEHGYDGGFSMEPHLQLVFHEEQSNEDKQEARLQAYIAYGHRFMGLLAGIGYPFDPAWQTDPR